MEFGIFIQGYMPEFRRAGRSGRRAPRDHGRARSVIEAADKAGFKYVLVTGAPLPRRVLAPLGQRRRRRVPREGDRPHPHRVGHLQPAAPGEPPGQGRRAGRDARPPLGGAVRVRHRPGRRAATRSSASCPGMHDRPNTREIWEDVIAEFPKMWMQDELRGLRGQVLVAAAAQDPARSRGRSRTRRCGTPRATRRATRWRPARASACSASRSATSTTWSRSSNVYKDAIKEAEPIGAFVNDNLMHHDRRRSWRRTHDAAVQSAVDARLELPAEQRVPLPRHVPASREVPVLARADPRLRRDDHRGAWPASARSSAATPTRPSSSAAGGSRPGADQLVFGIGSATLEETLKMIRLMGEHVIPKIDTDPVHRTTRMHTTATA